MVKELNIREVTQELERESLSSYAALSAETAGRDTPEEIARKDELERLAEDTSYKGLWKVSFTLKEL